MTDFVQWVLDALDSGWNTSNYYPKPILYHDEDKVRQDTGERTPRLELSENNAISVNADPTASNTPVGFEYAHRVRAGVDVVIEGAHEERDGEISDANEFKEGLVGEARRILLAERRYPSGIEDDGVHTLLLEEENNQSSGSVTYYRMDFAVWFRGYDRLPQSSF